jgi:hypothetical protein
VYVLCMVVCISMLCMRVSALPRDRCVCVCVCVLCVCVMYFYALHAC